jgi:hypothetical protein
MISHTPLAIWFKTALKYTNFSMIIKHDVDAKFTDIHAKNFNIC